MALAASCASIVEPVNYFLHPLEEERRKISKECTMNPDYFGYTMDRMEYSMFVLNGFNQIANNCLIICAKNKKHYGNDLKESIIIFNYF